jgi:hypothetical protein
MARATRSVLHTSVQLVERGLEKCQVPPNHCMQPTPQTVIKFAYANLPPVWGAADAGC